jgi:hypothetical protein
MLYVTVTNVDGNHGHKTLDTMSGLMIAKVLKGQYLVADYPYQDYLGLGNVYPKISSVTDFEKKVTVGDKVRHTDWHGLHEMIYSNGLDSYAYGRQSGPALLELYNGYRVLAGDVCNWYRRKWLMYDAFGEVCEDTATAFSKLQWKRPEPTGKLDIIAHIGIGIDSKTRYRKKYHTPHHMHYIFPMSYWHNMFNCVRERLSGHYDKIRIFTEAHKSDHIVDAFGDCPDIEICLGPDRRSYDGPTGGTAEYIHDTYYNFINCDLLLTCNSSFSLTTSFYRNQPGKVTMYNPNFEFFDLPEGPFRMLEDDGTFEDSLSDLKDIPRDFL